MNQSDRYFRWCFNLFIFLMCVNLGMVIALKSIYYQAENRMKNNQADVDFRCGDYDNSESFWKMPESHFAMGENCKNDSCPESYWTSDPEQQTESLHVVAVEKPQVSQMINGKLEPGHFVKLDVDLKEKPTTLVLVSRKMLQWNLKLPESQENLKEVIVIGPELVWLDGVSKETKVTYFNEDQICAYPTAWEEVKNPSNEYRRLARALKSYTDLEISSFQGKAVGREFRIPYQGPQFLKDIVKARTISSDSGKAEGPGVKWERQGKSIQATEVHFKTQGKMEKWKLPSGTRDAFFDQGSQKLFVIKNFQFGTWDKEKQKFSALRLPLKIPAMYWPLAMTFNPLRSEVYIYNDDRGGEIYIYNVVTGNWRKLMEKVGYSFISLHFDSNRESLFASRFAGQKILEIVELDAGGKVKGITPLEKPLDFTKSVWRAQFVQGRKDLWLKLFHPARPEGDLHLLPEPSKKM